MNPTQPRPFRQAHHIRTRVLGECRPRHTGADLLAFLKRIARVYRGRELHVVVDNSSTHSTPAVQAWLQRHSTVQLHFTPKGAS